MSSSPPGAPGGEAAPHQPSPEAPEPGEAPLPPLRRVCNEGLVRILNISGAPLRLFRGGGEGFAKRVYSSKNK